MPEIKSNITSAIRSDGTIIQYKLLMDTLKQYAGKSVDITIEKVKKKRSLQQNKVYWSLVVDPIRAGLHETGNYWSKEKVNEYLKFKFLKCWRTNEKTGEQFEDIQSTTELSTTSFEDFRLECREWAESFLGITLVDPDPDYMQNLREAKKGISI